MIFQMEEDGVLCWGLWLNRWIEYMCNGLMEFWDKLLGLVAAVEQVLVEGFYVVIPIGGQGAEGVEAKYHAFDQTAQHARWVG